MASAEDMAVTVQAITSIRCTSNHEAKDYEQSQDISSHGPRVVARMSDHPHG